MDRHIFTATHRLSQPEVHCSSSPYHGVLLSAAVAEVEDGHEVEDEEDGMCEDSDGGTSLELRIVPEEDGKCK